MIESKYISELILTKYTPYLALKGKLWGVYYGEFLENKLRYNSTTL